MGEPVTGVVADRRDLTQSFGRLQFEQAFRLVECLLSNTCSQQCYSASEASKFLLNDALDTTPVGIALVSLTGQVTYFNQRFAELWKIPPGILFTQKHSQYLAYCRAQVKDDDAFCDYIEQLSEQPHAADITTVELKDGRTLAQCFQPQKSGQVIGRIWGYAETTSVVAAQPHSLQRKAVLKKDQMGTGLVMADVTSLKQKNLYLSQQLAKEKFLTQQRLQLSAHVVHRALSSLNVVSMTADALELYDAHWSKAQKKNYLLQIRLAFERLNQFINKMNDISQLGVAKPGVPWPVGDDSVTNDSVGISTPTSALVDVYEVCCDLVENFKGIYKEHAFVSLNAADRTVVETDKSLLQAILTALLENASKYSSDSLIKLVFSRRDNSISLQVQDSGIGVPPSERDRLFDPFYRASNVGDVVGLGLGLTIARASTEALAGQIKFTSAADSGTLVTVVLPMT